MIQETQQEILLTTGVYDLIKDHLRRKKVTAEQENILTKELRHAEQILRRDLADNIVTVGKKVTIKELNSNQEYQLNFEIQIFKDRQVFITLMIDFFKIDNFQQGLTHNEGPPPDRASRHAMPDR